MQELIVFVDSCQTPSPKKKLSMDDEVSSHEKCVNLFIKFRDDERPRIRIRIQIISVDVGTVSCSDRLRVVRFHLHRLVSLFWASLSLPWPSLVESSWTCHLER